MKTSACGIASTSWPMPTKTKPTKPHWLSREMERFATPAITAALIGVGAFVWNILVTEPELAPVVRTVEQHEELINLLSQSVAQSSASIKSLATDRAGAVYGGATTAIARLEQKNRGQPFSAWDVEDQRLYDAAKTQLASAEQRLGISQGGTP